MTKPAAPPELHILSADEFDAILDRDDLGEKLVAMPEWGANVAVRIRGLSMDDIWHAREATKDVPAGSERTRAIDLEFLLAAITEPRLSRSQLERLSGKSADAVLRLIREISGLNASSAEAGEKLAGEFPAEREP